MNRLLLLATALAVSLSVNAHGSTVVVSGADSSTDCTELWDAWAGNAANLMPGPVTYLSKPNADYAADMAAEADNLYMISHGYYGATYPGCDRSIMLPSRFTKAQFDFAFFAICDGMCETGDGTFAETARESVGYCGMADQSCANCWWNSLSFQDNLLAMIHQGQGVRMAYDAAIGLNPECSGCMRYHYTERNVVAKTAVVGIALLLLKH